MAGPSRPLISLLIVAVVVAALGVPVAGTGADGGADVDKAQQLQPVESTPNTTRALMLDDVQRSDRDRATVSVTDAVQAETGAEAATLDERAVKIRLRNATTDDREAVRGLVNRTEARVEDLADREQRARDRYRDDEIGTTTYLGTIGAVNSEARALEARMDDLEELAAPYPDLQDRVTGQQTRTVHYVGPLVDDVGAAVGGGDPTVQVAVAAGENGFSISAIRGGTFSREIVRTDARDTAVGGVDLDAAQERIAELYPWSWANKGDVSINTVGEDVFRFQLSHDHGELESLLDTSSGAVYREVQTKSLSNLPVAPGPETTERNRTLTVSAPRPGWPVRIQVLNRTGEPVEATVSVEDEQLGQTGSEPIWYLSPAEPFNVTARADGRTLDLAVTPSRG